MSTPSSPIRLYRHPVSGHSHRVLLFLSLLGLPYEIIEVDMSKGAHKAPEFLAKNPFGQVPVIEDGEVTLADSHAILVYLARRYDDSGRWLPSDALGEARVQRWLAAAAGPLAFGPAAARRFAIFGAKVDFEPLRAIASNLFKVLELELQTSTFLAGADPTIADLAMYGYVAHAPEGGISLEPYPAVRAWLARIEGLRGFVPMAATRTALMA